MKRALRFLALILALGSAGLWLGLGANRGWTKTSVPIKKMDEVLRIEGITYEKRFVPGVDFLGGALLGTGVLAGASFLFRNQPKTSTPS